MECSYCDVEGYLEEICGNCDGSGEGTYDESYCTLCKGTGVLFIKCEVCDGTGYLDED